MLGAHAAPRKGFMHKFDPFAVSTAKFAWIPAHVGARSKVARMTRKIPMLAFVVAAALALPAAAPALPRAADEVSGATIVLPQKLVAGQPATLAVLTGDGKLAPGVQVEFSGGQRVTTDASGRASFTAPDEEGVLLVQIPDSPASASATVIAPGPPARVQLTQIPRVISLRDRFFVGGAGFRGEADEDQVRLGGQPGLVLAASPVNLVVLPSPQAALGVTQIAVSANGAEGSTVTTLVALEMISEKPSLAPRQRANLLVRIRGTDQPLALEARNLSPAVVHFVHGDTQRVLTRGGQENSAAIEMQGLSPGEFSFSVRIVPPPAGLPDVAAARQYLLAARKLAPPNQVRRVERLIKSLEQRPQEAVKVRNDLEKILAAKPKGQFGRLIEAAWEVLLNR
jgi:hypothetical protein